MQAGNKALKTITNANSTLVFVVPDEYADRPLDLRTILPVRKAITKSKVTNRGKVSDTEHECSHHAEGIVEFWGLRIMVATGHYDYIKVQPFLLKFKLNGKSCRYVGDALLVRGNRKFAVEFKTDLQADKRREYFKVVGGLLSEHGFIFVLWRASQVFRKPRIDHASSILRYRRVDVSDVECERVRRAFATESQMSIEQAAQISRISPQAVCHLALRGLLHIDWWAGSLDLDSLVSTVPIGEQVWPSPDAPLPEF